MNLVIHYHYPAAGEEEGDNILKNIQGTLEQGAVSHSSLKTLLTLTT